MRRLRPLQNVRGRLLTILLVALAAALGASTYGFNVLFAQTTSRSADSLLRARASTELALLAIKNGRLASAEISDDAVGDNQVWIFSRTSLVERPPAHTSLDPAASSLAGGPRRTLDISQADVRLYAVPIVLGGKRQGTLVTGLSLAPYEQAERTALLGSFALAAVMLALAGTAAWWLLQAALRPVAEMTEQAAAWSEHDLDRRFDRGEAHDELTQLAATLDSMLDRIGASLRHERRFSAELSHELRTPLARIIAEAELAVRRERDAGEYRSALELILRNAQQVARIVETLVAAAQHEADTSPGTADAYAVATGAIEGVTAIAQARKIELSAEQPGAPLRLGVDGDLAERVLQPIIENACRYAGSWARVRVTRDGSRVAFLIEDDGPGVTDAEREAIFDPGTRGTAGRNTPLSAGAGLGLALARRLARAASGDVTARTDTKGGCFVVTLPTA